MNNDQAIAEMNNHTDIAVIQAQVKVLDKNVTKIMENHLPHLQADIVSLKLKIAYWSGGAAVAGIATQIIISLIKR